MNDVKILVVDDEERMRKLIRDFLVKNGYIVIEASNGEEAFTTFTNENDIKLIIMDVMMPKMNGYETSEEIRKISDVPIIMLTARSEEKDELRGFDVGVDEYITKPFNPKILVARVEAVLRRTNSTETSSIVEAGGIVIDNAAHTVTVDGKFIELSFKEFELLEYFIANQGRALTRENILNRVWNYDYYGDARTIDTHVKKLRAKLGDKGKYITTIWAVGYKFEVKE
ncbi:MAG: response regulator transcription factor [Eubacterium sp.]|nr:response regulator transcription factor [Eubacterium sp.]